MSAKRQHHICPARNCTRLVPSQQLACRPHWYALPKRLRDAIWNAYAAEDWPTHRKAIVDALAWYRSN